MKIALYVPSWPPGARPNGIVTYAGHLVPALRRLGHEVFVLTPVVNGESADPYTIDLARYDRRPLWLRALFKVAPNFAQFHLASRPIVLAVERLISEHDIDIIEIEDSFGWSVAVTRRRLLPVTVRLHGPRFLTAQYSALPGETARERWRERAERKGIEGADFVTSPCQAMLDEVRSHYDLELSQSLAFANPIDRVAPEDRWSLATCDSNSLLFVGRFDGHKGGDLVIRAFAELASANPKLTLTFAGPDIGILGAAGNLIRFEAFCSGILSAEVRSRINFTGALPHAEVNRLRSRHFATLCASRSECFPYTVLEALASGSPVIASAVGGIPEMIDPGRNGLLFPREDVPALVTAVQALLDEPVLAARYGEQAWRDCERRFGADHLSGIAVESYRQAIAAFSKA